MSLVWSGGRKRDRDCKAQAATVGLCLAGGPTAVALGRQLWDIQGMVLLEVFVGSVWLLPPRSPPPHLFLSKELWA